MYLLVYTCIYFYLLLRLYLLYLLITRRTTPRRIFREECSGEEHDAKKIPRPIYVEGEARTRLADTLSTFLMLNDERIAAEAEIVDFPEFEAIKLVNRTRS